MGLEFGGLGQIRSDRTSRAGVLMLMGWMTVNSFLIFRTVDHGRCSFTLTQYRTLPCFPSNDVTSFLPNRITADMKAGKEGEGNAHS